MGAKIYFSHIRVPFLFSIFTFSHTHHSVFLFSFLGANSFKYFVSTKATVHYHTTYRKTVLLKNSKFKTTLHLLQPSQLETTSPIHLEVSHIRESQLTPNDFNQTVGFYHNRSRKTPNTMKKIPDR